MSDDELAEVITEAMGCHGAQTVEDGRDVCACGADIGPHEGNDWDELERHNVHLAAVLAATARAFIADELHAFGEQHSIGAYGTYGPPAIALSDAESIARGDTK